MQFFRLPLNLTSLSSTLTASDAVFKAAPDASPVYNASYPLDGLPYTLDSPRGLAYVMTKYPNNTDMIQLVALNISGTH